MAKVANPAVAPKLPLPLRGQKQYDFSFSGLKTAAVSAWGNQLWIYLRSKVFRMLFRRVVVLHQCSEAGSGYLSSTGLVIAGGVSANKRLRTRLSTDLAIEVMAPELSLCTDNPMMVTY